MEVYLVGGAVRDALLGLCVQDRDWVVVGATAQDLLARGFTPVGRDFPVFLHPQTHEEYALARTERNTGGGYRGFAVHAAPDVTLEDDLARRDLTINSIAIQVDFTGDGDPFYLNTPAPGLTGIDPRRVVDPFGGQRDLAAKVLRHVTMAFREDPVRILRLARFAARLTDFTVAPETLALMRTMVDAGDTDHLVAERVWQELARGLMEVQPSRMFGVLRACGALARLLPALDRLWSTSDTTGEHVMHTIDLAARLGASLPVRYACLVLKMGSDSNFLARVPSDCRELAAVVARECDNIHASLAWEPDAVLQLMERCDAIRKPERFAEVLLACACDARAHAAMRDATYPQGERLQRALCAVQEVATETIAEEARLSGASGPEIGKRVRQARLQAVARQLSQSPPPAAEPPSSQDVS